jgi:hypothetical protein
VVISDDNDCDVRVLIGDRPWNYSPANLTLVAKAADGDATVQEPSVDSTGPSSGEEASDSDEDPIRQLLRSKCIE